MESIGTIKRGATFETYAIFKDPQGAPYEVNLADLSSHVRDVNENLISRLTVTQDPVTTNKFYFRAEDTKTWPLGTLYTDIRYEVGGVVQFSQTRELTVERAMTYE